MPRATKPRSTSEPVRPPVTYPIRAVSLMTGVSIDTLRAWERRYAAVTPLRDDRGRIYTDADVRRIRLLRHAVEHGHAIGRVATMTDEQLASLTAGPSRVGLPAVATQAPVPMIDTNHVMAALDRFDVAALESELARAAALLHAPELLRDVLVPLLTKVGERWHNGQGRVAHEHMLSASVRNVLGSLLRLHMRAGAPDRLLFTTPAGERHEFGTLGAAMLAASGGLGTVYLGPDMPGDDIVAVATVLDLHVVVLGISDAGVSDRVEKEVEIIARRLDPKIELWLGGRGAAVIAKRLKGRARVLQSYEELQEQLVRVGARF